MSDDPDWEHVLTTIYETHGWCQVPTITDETPDHVRELASEKYDIDKQTDISETRTSAAMDYLAGAGLIEQYEDKTVVTEDGNGGVLAWQLTEKGFEVAHERELAEKSNDINYALVFFTLVLVITEAVGVAPIGAGFRVLASLIILVGLVVAVWRTDILER